MIPGFGSSESREELMARRSILGSLFGAVVLMGLPVAASSTGEYQREVQRLDTAIDRYAEVQQQEIASVRHLEEIWAMLESSAEDPDVAVGELRRLDDELERARERACELVGRSHAIRLELYDHMDTLSQLAREIDAAEIAIPRDTPAGLWSYEASPMGVRGLLELRVAGSLVEGEYRANNGNHGSVRGTFSGGLLQLDRIDADIGAAGTVEGKIDPETGELRGTWNAMDLSSGLSAHGEWVAAPIVEDQGHDLE